MQGSGTEDKRKIKALITKRRTAHDQDNSQ